MSKWSVLGFAFGFVCVVVVAGIIYLANNMQDLRTAAVDHAPPAGDPPPPPPAAPVTPAAPAAPAAPAVPEIPPEQNFMTMARTSTGFQPGQPVDVTVRLEYGGEAAVRALGMEEVVPSGWRFEGVTGGVGPDISRQLDGADLIEFAWFNIPDFPVEFTYRVRAGADSEAQEITGTALYRTEGAEVRSDPAVTVVALGEPASAEVAVAAAAPESAAPPAAPAEHETGGVSLERYVPANAFTPGQPVVVEFTVHHEGRQPVTALAIEENLPEGWVFDSVVGGERPAVSPQQGVGGAFNLIYINTPGFPFKVSYLAIAPDDAPETVSLEGRVIYRKLADELRSEPVVTELRAER